MKEELERSEEVKSEEKVEKKKNKVVRKEAETSKSEDKE